MGWCIEAPSHCLRKAFCKVLMCHWDHFIMGMVDDIEPSMLRQVLDDVRLEDSRFRTFRAKGSTFSKGSCTLFCFVSNSAPRNIITCEG